MKPSDESPREGSLEAPTRHAIEWRAPDYTDAEALQAELTRVFDVCHGCRRCFSLCNAFPTLFDAIDESPTGELDEVSPSVFRDVVDHCYLCDMCYMSKCPYVPPHPWNIDFPHLMLRAKVKRFRDGEATFRDKLLSATVTVGKVAGVPVVSEAVNAINASKLGRKLLESTLGVDTRAPVPKYHSQTARKRLRGKVEVVDQAQARAADDTLGRVVVFSTCYGNYNHPSLVEDLVAVFEHNEIATRLLANERCCGMPKLELGDLETIERFKSDNIEALHAWVERGWDITAAIPSCVLMFKQELPLLFPEDAKVQAVAKAFFDPFEYLMIRHRAGALNTDFKQSLGSVSYQVPCHLRVQNIGLKTRDLLELVPATKVEAIERCSGHDGTYGVKKKYRDAAEKIARPVARRVSSAAAEHFTSDCPMAAEQIAGLSDSVATHPLQLLRRAYGI